MDIGWSDFKKLLTDVVKLTSNVSTLQSQLETALQKIDSHERELANLRADLRVARAELEGEAVKAASSTVIQAHEQMISRFVDVERKLVVLTEGGTGEPLLNGPDNPI